jgi:hypothetical protein
MKSGRFAVLFQMYLFCSFYATPHDPLKIIDIEFLFRSCSGSGLHVAGRFGIRTRQGGWFTLPGECPGHARQGLDLENRDDGSRCRIAVGRSDEQNPGCRNENPAGKGGIRCSIVGTNQVMGASLISTRRLAARPSGVAFEAIGCVSPRPRMEKRRWSTPCAPR